MTQHEAADGAAAPQPPLAGLRAIVTGGASGIGLATAVLLSTQGARVAVFDLATAIESGVQQSLLGVPVDVTDDQSVTAGVGRAVDELGGIDILVNNAGIGARGTVEENPMAEWQHVFDVNVFGIVRVTKAALPYLRHSPSAAVVNTCSVAATAGIPARALYSATKGAVLSLTQAMAADHIGEQIRFNCVNPGTADTPWVGRLLQAADDPAAERAALEARQPHGRLVTAEEVAGAIAYLVAPSSGSTTGVALPVDGGMQALRLRPVQR